MDMVYIYGRTKKNMREISKIMLYMDMGIIFGQIKGNILECLLWEKEKELENIIGMMGEFM